MLIFIATRHLIDKNGKSFNNRIQGNVGAGVGQGFQKRQGL